MTSNTPSAARTIISSDFTVNQIVTFFFTASSGWRQRLAYDVAGLPIAEPRTDTHSGVVENNVRELLRRVKKQAPQSVVADEGTMTRPVTVRPAIPGAAGTFVGLTQVQSE